MKGTRGHKKGRLMNIVLCSMQLITPLLTLTAFMIVVGKESKLSMITKDYITIGMILGIDNRFAGLLPKEMSDNAKKINKDKGFLIPKDNNKFSHIFKRLW